MPKPRYVDRLTLFSDRESINGEEVPVVVVVAPMMSMRISPDDGNQGRALRAITNMQLEPSKN